MSILNKQEIGKRLKLLPKLLNTTNRQIALTIEADPGYYSRAVQGKGIKLEYIEKIIEVYRIERDWILFGEGTQFNSKIQTEAPLSGLTTEPVESDNTNFSESIFDLPISDKEKIALYRDHIIVLQKEITYLRKYIETLKTLIKK